jgi:hypothetical protein
LANLPLAYTNDQAAAGQREKLTTWPTGTVHRQHLPLGRYELVVTNDVEIIFEDYLRNLVYQSLLIGGDHPQDVAFRLLLGHCHTVAQLAGFAPSLQARSSRCRPGQRLPMKKLVRLLKKARKQHNSAKASGREANPEARSIWGPRSACRDKVDYGFPFSVYDNMLRGLFLLVI